MAAWPEAVAGGAVAPAEVSAIRVALGTVARRQEIRVGETRVSYRVWDSILRDSQLTIVLLHGNAARSEWWDAVVPLLAAQARVVAVDLSGHGDSDWRPSYGFDTWVAEVMGVVNQESPMGPVSIVGHSMGGLVGLRTAWAEPDRVRTLTLVDTPFRRYSEDELEKRSRIADRAMPYYSSRVAAIDNFKTAPPLRWRQADIWRHVAESSFCRDAEGWRLHFDPNLYRRRTNLAEFLKVFPPNTTIVRAEHGLISAAMVEEMRSYMPQPQRIVDIEGVGHNLILESPLTVARVLSALIHGGSSKVE